MVHGDGPARCNRSCLFSTNLNDLTFMILVDPLLTYYLFSFDLTEIPLILSLGISSAKKAKGQFKSNWSLNSMNGRSLESRPLPQFLIQFLTFPK